MMAEHLYLNGLSFIKGAHVMVFTTCGRCYEGMLWDMPGFHIILRPVIHSPEDGPKRTIRLCEDDEEVLIFLNQIISITVACSARTEL